MKCRTQFSMGAYRWYCDTHEEYGDETGCLSGARERIAELELALDRFAPDTDFDIDAEEEWANKSGFSTVQKG